MPQAMPRAASATISAEASTAFTASPRSAIRAADIGHVGEVAVELLLVFVPQGQLPGTVAAGGAGFEDLGGQLVVVGHQPAGLVAERDDLGLSGEGGEGDPAVALDTIEAAIAERLGQLHGEFEAEAQPARMLPSRFRQ